jgi:D-3-phosphoglycerate dehydrogenase
VLENEKINTWSSRQNSELELLFKTQKVIITPHIAGWTFESKLKLAEILSKKMILSWNSH